MLTLCYLSTKDMLLIQYRYMTNKNRSVSPTAKIMSTKVMGAQYLTLKDAKTHFRGLVSVTYPHLRNQNEQKPEVTVF